MPARLFIDASSLFIFKNRDDDLDFKRILGRLMNMGAPSTTLSIYYHHKLSCLYSVKSIFRICDYVLVFNLVWMVVFV